MLCTESELPIGTEGTCGPDVVAPGDNPYPVSVSQELASAERQEEPLPPSQPADAEGPRKTFDEGNAPTSGCVEAPVAATSEEAPLPLPLPAEVELQTAELKLPLPLPPPPAPTEAEAQGEEQKRQQEQQQQQQQQQQLDQELQMRAAAAAAQSVGISPEMAQALSQTMSSSLGGGVPGSLEALGGPIGDTMLVAAQEAAAADADDVSPMAVDAAPLAEVPMGIAAAAATSATAAAAAVPTVMVEATPTSGIVGGALVLPAEADIAESADGEPRGDQSHTCTVCRKVFKREMNLIFHMTTHRPRQPQADPVEPTSSAPVKCQDCGKVFATKYQAKKHFLRRHFAGDKPFACTKCGKKRFVVKEDMTMHMKSCGNVYTCKCGIRLCSLGALKRHCKYFEHEAKSYEPEQENPIKSPSPPPYNPRSHLATSGTSSLVGGPAPAADAAAYQRPDGLLGTVGGLGRYGSLGGGLASSLGAMYGQGMAEASGLPDNSALANRFGGGGFGGGLTAAGLGNGLGGGMGGGLAGLGGLGAAMGAMGAMGGGSLADSLAAMAGGLPSCLIAALQHAHAEQQQHQQHQQQQQQQHSAGSLGNLSSLGNMGSSAASTAALMMGVGGGRPQTSAAMNGAMGGASCLFPTSATAAAYGLPPSSLAMSSGLSCSEGDGLASSMASSMSATHGVASAVPNAIERPYGHLPPGSLPSHVDGGDGAANLLQLLAHAQHPAE